MCKCNPLIKTPVCGAPGCRISDIIAEKNGWVSDDLLREWLIGPIHIDQEFELFGERFQIVIISPDLTYKLEKVASSNRFRVRAPMDLLMKSYYHYSVSSPLPNAVQTLCHRLDFIDRTLGTRYYQE